MLCRYEIQSCFLLAFLAVTAFFISGAQGQVSPPTRLRYNVVSPDSVQISWKAPKGQFTGYKLLVTPSSGGKTNQLILQNTATKAIIQGLIPDQNYALQIIAFSEDTESKPAQGQFRIKDIERRKETSKSKVKDPEKSNASKPAPEGVDYNVKTITVDNTQVALQLWDTAGQERYRSITKQFFRKADGVIVMYDITAKDTFTAVKQWLISIEETTGENVPVLLLGNKTDNEKEREVPMGMGEHLAKDYNLIFYECSAYSGYNTKKSVLHLARILKEQEDKVKEKTIELQSDMNKKSCCIRP